jgi:hypothetical protein
VKPDLLALLAHYQTSLRLLDWRIKIAYVADLKSPAGDDVWGLCWPVADAKTAEIAIRDPETPPPGATPEEAISQVTETVIHELVHLHFAWCGTRSQAEVTAEEQSVWALSEALAKASGRPDEARLARAMVAKISALAPRARSGGKMDPKLIGEAIDALTAGDAAKALDILKALVVAAAGGAAAPTESEGDPAAPPEGAPMGAAAPGEVMPPKKEEEPAAMKARAAIDHETGRARSAATSLVGSAVRAMIFNAREHDGIALAPAIEARILKASSVEDAETILSTVRETLAANGGAQVRARSGAKPPGGKTGSVEGMTARERATYAGLVTSNPKAAELYADECAKTRARAAAKAGAK